MEAPTTEDMKVGEIRNREVIVAQGDTVLSEAGYLMREHHVGSLVVVDQTNTGCVPVGVVTDRDRAVARDARDEVTAHGE
jgi:predicted transcriptional regulator